MNNLTLTEQEIACLKKAKWTFGYREIDNFIQTFKELKRRGLVYETVRAFYITDAGRAALASTDSMKGE